jgi:uncharacterized Tic20 family protein
MPAYVNWIKTEAKMIQPIIGQRVAELRQQKSLTQERLAELCDVSTRTIQRIESGEVEPRSYTRSSLSSVLEFDFGEDTTRNDTLWLVVMHLSSILVMVIIPLLIWSWKRKTSAAIDRQGREVLNFQITMTILLFGAALLMLGLMFGSAVFVTLDSTTPNLLLTILVSISMVPLILIGIFSTIQGIRNTILAVGEKPIHYPLSIHFIK